EHPGDAPHTDAAKYDDDEADEREKILGTLQAFTNLILGRSVRAGIDEPISKLAIHGAGQRFDAVLSHFQQHLIVAATAECQQSCLLQIRKIDQDARTQAETP